MAATESRLAAFYERLASIYKLKTVESLLDWDQQVNLPEKAGPFRGEQLAHLASLVHEAQVDPAFLSLLDELACEQDSLPPEDRVNVRECREKANREQRLPASLVSERVKAASESYLAWVPARRGGTFADVLPQFKRLLLLVKEEARCTMVSDNPYDSLFDLYEPGARIAEVKPLLLSCADRLSDMVPKIIESADDEMAQHRSYPQREQEALARTVAAAIGYDFASGRLDIAPHPFQTTLGPEDFRMTTRWTESSPFPGLFGVLHEAGHALYEAGLPKKWAGTPRGSPVSLGIHESQSRFWENMIGRSRAFCEYLSPVLRRHFPQTRALSPQDTWTAVNRVARSLTRVEADEVTYTLHIVIRMILEEDLVNGSLEPADLPDAWRALYERYLDIAPPDDRLGVLQDIHWFSGSIGYFPTYALGNIFGAIFREEIRKSLPDSEELVARGEFGPILRWLGENVHAYGMAFRSPELIQKITGRPVSAEPFLTYIREKFLNRAA